MRKILVYPEMLFWCGVLTFQRIYELYQIDWAKKLIEAAVMEGG